jgi:hypothetical protein
VRSAKTERNDRLFAVPRRSHSERDFRDVADLSKPIQGELEKFYIATDEQRLKVRHRRARLVIDYKHHTGHDLNDMVRMWNQSRIVAGWKRRSRTNLLKPVESLAIKAERAKSRLIPADKPTTRGLCNATAS